MCSLSLLHNIYTHLSSHRIISDFLQLPIGNFTYETPDNVPMDVYFNPYLGRIEGLPHARWRWSSLLTNHLICGKSDSCSLQDLAYSQDCIAQSSSRMKFKQWIVDLQPRSFPPSFKTNMKRKPLLCPHPIAHNYLSTCKQANRIDMFGHVPTTYE